MKLFIPLTPPLGHFHLHFCPKALCLAEALRLVFLPLKIPQLQSCLPWYSSLVLQYFAHISIIALILLGCCLLFVSLSPVFDWKFMTESQVLIVFIFPVCSLTLSKCLLISQSEEGLYFKCNILSSVIFQLARKGKTYLTSTFWGLAWPYLIGALCRRRAQCDTRTGQEPWQTHGTNSPLEDLMVSAICLWRQWVLYLA